jgi:predicted small secreted protein
VHLKPGYGGPMRRRFAVALVGLCGLLAACSSTVSGAGTIAADAARPSGGPTASGSAEPSPSASASGADTGRSSLTCSGSKISPAGSPYCFVKPAGFQDVSSSVTVDASIGQEKYRSAVALGDRDLIIVSVYELRADTDAISDDTLEGELKTVLARLAQQGFTFRSTSADKTTVDGARSFGYHASQKSSGLESDVYFLFRGKNELQVNCQWKTKEADITKGCKSVLSSLQFKSVK